MKKLTILAFLSLVAMILLVLPATSTHSASHLFTGMNEVEKIIGDELAGTLEVTKEVDWGTSPVNEEQLFEICITGPSYPDGNCQVVGYEGGTLTWGDLMPGDYTVEETDPGETWDVAISALFEGETEMMPVEGPFTIGPKETVLVTVENTSTAPAPEHLSLTSMCSETPNDQTARWRVQNPNPFPIDFTYEIYGTDETGTMNVAPESETFFETENLGTARIFVDDMLNDTAEMRTECGVIEVTKVVRWEDIQPHPYQTFTLCLTRGESGEPDCKVVGYSGGVLHWSGLPYDDYTITEVAPGDPWIVEGAPQTVTVDTNEPVEIQITNRNTCEPGDPTCDTGGEIDLTEYEVIITPEEGGTLTIHNFTITFPPGAVPESVRLVFGIPENPPEGLDPEQFALEHFTLNAYALSDGDEISEFLREYIISMTYVADEVMERIEGSPTLYLAYANEQGEWVVMDSVVDPDQAIVITRSDHFTEFALIVTAAPPSDDEGDNPTDPTATPVDDADDGNVPADPTATPVEAADDGDGSDETTAAPEPTATAEQDADDGDDPATAPEPEPTATAEQDANDADDSTAPEPEPTATAEQDADDPATAPEPDPEQDGDTTTEPAPAEPDDIAPEAEPEPEPDSATTPEPSQQSYLVYLPIVRN